MAFGSRLIIPLLFGIIIPCTVAMKTFIQILDPATGQWKQLTVQLLEEDSFGGSVTGLSRETLVTALGLDDKTIYTVLESFLQRGIQDKTMQILVERFSINRKTENVRCIFDTIKDEDGKSVGVYGFVFTYDLPKVKLYYNSEVGWDGLYNGQTSEMKLIRKDSEQSDLENLLAYFPRQTWWYVSISNPGQDENKMTFKEPTAVGALKHNNGYTSLILALNKFVEICILGSKEKFGGYIFAALGKIELYIRVEQLDAVKASIQNAVWGYYYTDPSNTKFNTVHPTAIGDTKKSEHNGQTYLVVNYVEAVRMYNQSHSFILYGLKTDVDGQIKIIDTQSNLENLQAWSQSTSESWHLDIGMEGVYNIATFQAPGSPVARSGGLYSLIVNYTLK